MQTFQDIENIRKIRAAEQSKTWGLVPTMGALHEGHMSLVRRARAENERVAVSIFVNPIQFNNPDDLEKYPRTVERDLMLLEDEDVDLVWTPPKEIVYPPRFQTHVAVEKITQVLEGATRPGHFLGVTTVVAKLFNMFQPHRAYLGQKDYQQLAVIRQMVNDLNFPIELVPCPIVREADGLAMSSRNVNLSAEGRQQATCLYQSLVRGKELIDAGERTATNVRREMTDIVLKHDRATIDYISIANPDNLNELETIERKVLISMAVFIDSVRLIDNMEVEV
ncbi:pantoate--beta-alanine ligase [candidate division KSB1 bacterium]|nr:pantoate--beta-alanine ligase [candidate division KSB1 bacterium]